MREYSTVISGFGGQGVILAGKILARTGMERGLEVTWLPSYGPEMRGGTANCTAIISSKLIGSPIVDSPSALIAMNPPSLDKFETRVQENGLIVVNSSLVDEPKGRDNIKVVNVPLNEIAKEIGNQKVINMVALGAWAKFVEEISLQDVIKGMEMTLTDMGKERFIGSNREALEKGFGHAE
ncbi:2-oxoacid:acceptor oxidoreductase family protein [Candidatus Bipolaricaulota bacterium]|nr:2-oxoacid:acceptor oxidoreductase family protein [Candidatus Bipolaricaulota bacterium]